MEERFWLERYLGSPVELCLNSGQGLPEFSRQGVASLSCQSENDNPLCFLFAENFLWLYLF